MVTGLAGESRGRLEGTATWRWKGNFPVIWWASRPNHWWLLPTLLLLTT